MARCVITGGAGFIGTNLCKALRGRGDSVIAIDDLSLTDRNVPFLKSIGVQVVIAGIENYDDIKPHFKGADVVIHLAAMNRAPKSIEDPLRANEVNITGTLHVLEAMRSHKVPKIIFASSSSVYAGREGLLTENNPVAPPHPYGVGKLAGEHYVRVYGELFGISWVTLRFFSIYGPYQLGDSEHAAVIGKFIHQAHEGKPLTVYGDGTQQRNFTYVDDCVRSIVLAMEKQEAIGNIINIANPVEVTVNAIVAEIKELRLQATVTNEPKRAGDPPRNPADTGKAKKLLGYVPEIPLREGMKRYNNWYEEEFHA